MEFERSVSLRRRRGLNLTSLIDVIFLLVIFFMLTSKYMTYELVRLRLSTLQPGFSQKTATPMSLLITLAPNGVYIMNNTRYTLDALLTHIKPLIDTQAAQNLSVTLSPQKTITVQEMLSAMERLKMLGIQNISLVEVP